MHESGTVQVSGRRQARAILKSAELLESAEVKTGPPNTKASTTMSMKIILSCVEDDPENE